MEEYTMWKILCRLNKIKTKYFMLERDRFISIKLLMRMSSSWEKNFCGITLNLFLLLQCCETALNLDSILLGIARK